LVIFTGSKSKLYAMSIVVKRHDAKIAVGESYKQSAHGFGLSRSAISLERMACFLTKI